MTITVNGKAIKTVITGQVSGGIQGPALATSRQTLGSAAASLAVSQYDVTLRPAVSAPAYVQHSAAASGLTTSSAHQAAKRPATSSSTGPTSGCSR